jgi:hypothetical protein
MTAPTISHRGDHRSDTELQSLRTRSREAVHDDQLTQEIDVMDASKALQSIGVIRVILSSAGY